MIRDNVAVIAHCDWSNNPAKRWMAVAQRQQDRWHLTPPELVGDTSTLLHRLEARAVDPGALLLGFDFPIGVPLSYGRSTEFRNFREALAGFGSTIWADWYSVASHQSQISLHRPFYPMRPGGTSRRHLLDALRLAHADQLLRACERPTANRGAACPLFWTLGGNQVGKAAISGWLEMIVPNLETASIWPFDGSLAQLTSSNSVVLAETYPADVYSRLGIQRLPRWSKRKRAGRQQVGVHLVDWLRAQQVTGDELLANQIADGFGDTVVGEDQFDAVVGLFGLIDVVDGRTPEGTPEAEDIRRWEGWIIGQVDPQAGTQLAV